MHELTTAPPYTSPQVEIVRAQAREAVAQALLEHSEAMQAAERQSVRQLKQV